MTFFFIFSVCLTLIISDLLNFAAPPVKYGHDMSLVNSVCFTTSNRETGWMEQICYVSPSPLIACWLESLPWDILYRIISIWCCHHIFHFIHHAYGLFFSHENINFLPAKFHTSNFIIPWKWSISRNYSLIWCNMFFDCCDKCYWPRYMPIVHCLYHTPLGFCCDGNHS